MHSLDGLVAVWKEKSLAALNAEATIAVQEFFELICDVRINPNIGFPDKLIFLRDCVGDVDLALEAGFRADLFESWCDGSQEVVPEMQRAIMGLYFEAFILKVKSFDTINQALILLKHQMPIVPASVPPLPFDPWLSIKKLELPVRCHNCLYNAGYDHVTKRDKTYRFLGEVVQLTEPEILRIPNFGRKSLRELIKALGDKGARLNMQHPQLDRFNDEMKARSKTDE